MTAHHCDACRRDAEARTIPPGVWWPITSQLKDRGWSAVGPNAGADVLLCENPGLNAVALRWDGWP